MTAPTGESSGPFQEFFQKEAAGGVVLVCCAAVALGLANSPWAAALHHFWETPIAIGVAGRTMSLSLHAWINDALMAVFFLLVGLEIKREIVAGELASPRQAALPIAGALGGMLLPAVLFLLVSDSGGARGWAIPTATDIAFALGVLSLVAPQAPSGLKIFLAALAIVDDMGAVVVIALFYTTAIVWPALGAAVVILCLLVALNAAGVRSLTAYLILGVALWFFTFQSGIHSTIAGVLLALTIPTKTRIDAAQYSARARALLDEFDRTETGDLLVLTSKGQQEAIISLERASEAVTAPLLRLEHALHAFSGFVIMPLFALSNAGVALDGGGSRLTWAVAIGLIAGKPLGITLASWLAVQLRWASLPGRVSWRMLHGCAWLGGIGFTMSLFIAGLAFDEPSTLDAAKLGILGGSLTAGLMGAWQMRASVAKA